MALFIPTYFSPISQYHALLNSNSITFEVEDNYQKQASLRWANCHFKDVCLNLVSQT